MEYYSALKREEIVQKNFKKKRKEILAHTPTQMSLGDTGDGGLITRSQAL